MLPWYDLITLSLFYRDKDGVPDIEDNCKYIDNSDQLDTDGDAAGMMLTYLSSFLFVT